MAIKLAGNLATALLQTECTSLSARPLASTHLNLHPHKLVCTCLYLFASSVVYFDAIMYMFFILSGNCGDVSGTQMVHMCATTQIHVGREISISSVYT